MQRIQPSRVCKTTSESQIPSKSASFLTQEITTSKTTMENLILNRSNPPKTRGISTRSKPPLQQASEQSSNESQASSYDENEEDSDVEEVKSNIQYHADKSFLDESTTEEILEDPEESLEENSSISNEDIVSEETNSFDEDQDLEFDWQEITQFSKPPFPRFPLKYGVTRDLSNLYEAKDFFSLIVSDHLLTNICDWTNHYAETKRSHRRRDSHERKWDNITPEKLKAFLGILMLIPLMQKPKMSDYWSNSILTGTPGIRNIFSRDEFYIIKRYIRFHDHLNIDSNDPFYKIRPLFAEILENTNSLYRPPKNIALDESLVKYDDRSAYKVYMPMKPIKYGFKVYSVVPSDVPIVLNMEIHDGRKRSLRNIVCSLLSPFEGKGHVVYMNRYYMMPKVVKALENMNIGHV